MEFLLSKTCLWNCGLNVDGYWHNNSNDLSELNSILSSLCKHESVLKLCQKILMNIVRDPTNEKFQSLNDTKLASKCNPDEYVYLSRFLKLIGFQRKMISIQVSSLESSSECRWIYNKNTNIQLLNKFINKHISEKHFSLQVKKTAFTSYQI